MSTTGTRTLVIDIFQLAEQHRLVHKSSNETTAVKKEGKTTTTTTTTTSMPASHLYYSPTEVLQSGSYFRGTIELSFSESSPPDLYEALEERLNVYGAADPGGEEQQTNDDATEKQRQEEQQQQQQQQNDMIPHIRVLFLGYGVRLYTAKPELRMIRPAAKAARHLKFKGIVGTIPVKTQSLAAPPPQSAEGGRTAAPPPLFKHANLLCYVSRCPFCLHSRQQRAAECCSKGTNKQRQKNNKTKKTNPPPAPLPQPTVTPIECLSVIRAENLVQPLVFTSEDNINNLNPNSSRRVVLSVEFVRRVRPSVGEEPQEREKEEEEEEHKKKTNQKKGAKKKARGSAITETPRKQVVKNDTEEETVFVPAAATTTSAIYNINITYRPGRTFVEQIIRVLEVEGLEHGECVDRLLRLPSGTSHHHHHQHHSMPTQHQQPHQNNLGSSATPAPNRARPSAAASATKDWSPAPRMQQSLHQDTPTGILEAHGSPQQQQHTANDPEKTHCCLGGHATVMLPCDMFVMSENNAFFRAEVTPGVTIDQRKRRLAEERMRAPSRKARRRGANDTASAMGPTNWSDVEEEDDDDESEKGNCFIFDDDTDNDDRDITQLHIPDMVQTQQLPLPSVYSARLCEDSPSDSDDAEEGEEYEEEEEEVEFDEHEEERIKPVHLPQEQQEEDEIDEDTGAMLPHGRESEDSCDVYISDNSSASHDDPNLYVQ